MDANREPGRAVSPREKGPAMPAPAPAKVAKDSPPVIAGEEPRPAAATWQVKRPTGAWHENLPAQRLPFLDTYQYRDEYALAAAGPPGWAIVGGTRRGRMHAND